MEVSIIGLDLAKNVFQVHGVDAAGRIVIRRAIRRSQVLPFFAKLPSCLVGLEACGTSHHWARELLAVGHDVRLMPPAYVKPYVKRGKTDAADAAAICEAVTRPMLARQIIEGKEAPDLPGHAVKMLAILCRQTLAGHEQIREIDRDLMVLQKSDEMARRLATIPGIGPIGATAFAAAVTDPGQFKSGRQFAAWLGLTPLQNSSGGKERLGRISKMGDKYLRRLLVIGATALVRQFRNRPDKATPHFASLLARKPVRVATVAMANKMARIVWALMTRGETYRAAHTPALAA
jgi:transposase